MYHHTTRQSSSPCVSGATWTAIPWWDSVKIKCDDWRLSNKRRERRLAYAQFLLLNWISFLWITIKSFNISRSTSIFHMEFCLGIYIFHFIVHPVVAWVLPKDGRKCGAKHPMLEIYKVRQRQIQWYIMPLLAMSPRMRWLAMATEILFY